MDSSALPLPDRLEPGVPLVWLYRGAWQEGEIHRADVFLTARALDRLGLPEFYAAEAYVVTERLL